MKKCPFCAEVIQDQAIICRYCGRELVQTAKEPKHMELQNPDAIPLGEVIFKYESKGYVIIGLNENSAVLDKGKPFPLLIIILSIPAFLSDVWLGFSVLGVGFIIQFFLKKRTVYLAVGEDGVVVSTNQNGKKLRHLKTGDVK